MSGRILFVSHDATRTGAPIALLHFLDWLAEHSSFELGVALLNGGELETELARFGLVHRVGAQARTSVPRRIARQLLPQGLGSHERATTNAWRSAVARFEPDVVYANTAVATAFVATRGLPDAVPLVAHLHELAYTIEAAVGRAAFTRAAARVDHFICPSEAVRTNLLANHGLCAEQTSVIRGPVRPDCIGAPNDAAAARRELGVPEREFLVLGAGTAVWHKGPDLFVQTARLVNDTARGSHFAWIGHVDPRMRRMLAHDIERLGLETLVHFPGVRPGIAPYLAAADVFFLPSREDSYPLVGLEAACHEKPIVCFAGAGGLPEFVREDAGRVVPYLDVAAAARRIVQLEADPALRAALGARARERAVAESGIDVVGPAIAAEITAVLGAGRRR